MTFLEVALGIAVLLLAAATAGLAVALKRSSSRDELELDQAKVRGAVSESWQRLELGEKIKSLEKEVENVEEEAERIQQLHRDIETMLENPQERGEFGERKLEDILSRHLPAEMFGLQEEVAGKRPDAVVESTSGMLCVDSKFPLSNFRRMMEAEDEDGKERLAKKFRRDVDSQLEEVRKKYVRPEDGTTEYALEFVPSERVYYYLVKEEYEMLQEYAQQGVQLVSPLTLGHKLQVIKNDVHTARLSEKADKIRESMQEISGAFQDFEDDWKTFRRHIENAKSKSDELERRFEELKSRFQRVNELES